MVRDGMGGVGAAERGRRAEALALAHLQRAGLRLVQANYRVARGPSARGGEIDLILREPDGTIVFVEVRSRSATAARFGGAAASVCVLLYAGPLGETGKARLKAMLDTQDGFEIARRDLEIRGPGEFMGARQSGDALLRFADLAEDSALLQHARRIAPLLLDQHAEAARRHVQRWLGAGAEFMKA